MKNEGLQPRTNAGCHGSNYREPATEIAKRTPAKKTKGERRRENREAAATKKNRLPWLQPPNPTLEIAKKERKKREKVR